MVSNDLGPNGLQKLSADDNSRLGLTLYLLVLSADNLCKQFKPRSCLTRLQDYLNLG